MRHCYLIFNDAKIQIFFDMVIKKATNTFRIRPLESFHNGIILIVNCFKSGAKIRKKIVLAKKFVSPAPILLASLAA